MDVEMNEDDFSMDSEDEAMLAEAAAAAGPPDEEEDAPEGASDDEDTRMDIPLDVQHADNLVWLAKVPMFLLDKWQGARANAVLGHMHEHKTFVLSVLYVDGSHH